MTIRGMQDVMSGEKTERAHRIDRARELGYIDIIGCYSYDKIKERAAEVWPGIGGHELTIRGLSLDMFRISKK